MNVTKFTWLAPTFNVDGTPVAAGEITGYNIGIRQVGVGAAGTYPITLAVAGAGTLSALLSAITPPLAFGVEYTAAIQTTGPANSAWSNELGNPFTLTAPTGAETPNPPTSFAVS